MLFIPQTKINHFHTRYTSGVCWAVKGQSFWDCLEFGVNKSFSKKKQLDVGSEPYLSIAQALWLLISPIVYYKSAANWQDYCYGKEWKHHLGSALFSDTVTSPNVMMSHYIVMSCGDMIVVKFEASNFNTLQDMNYFLVIFGINNFGSKTELKVSTLLTSYWSFCFPAGIPSSSWSLALITDT